MGVLEMMVVIGRLPVLQLLCCEALWCLNQGWKSWCACCARTAEKREATVTWSQKQIIMLVTQSMNKTQKFNLRIIYEINI